MVDWIRSAKYLLETLTDSLAGFDYVAEHAHRFDFYSYCEHYVLQRDALTKEFRGSMRNHGPELPLHGTVLASVHRLYLDMTIARDSCVVTMLQELIRGETYLASRVDGLLDHDGLPPEIYEVARLIRTNVSQSLLDLEAMKNHASRGAAAGSSRLFK